MYSIDMHFIIVLEIRIACKNIYLIMNQMIASSLALKETKEQRKKNSYMTEPESPLTIGVERGVEREIIN